MQDIASIIVPNTIRQITTDINKVELYTNGLNRI